MSIDRELLEQHRDQALRDLVDLERQVAGNEIPAQAAEKLRHRYEAVAARAIETLEKAPRPESQKSPRTPRRSRAKLIAYTTAAAVAVFAAAVLLPQYVASRPEGGFVTGNEVVQAPSSTGAAPAPPPRDLSTVTEAEMEAVVKDNPTVVGMRVALANRYLQKGNYDKAGEHYGVALKQDPSNPEVLAGAGWLLFKMGQTDGALRFVDQALGIAPTLADALWYKANILLEGRKDASGALEILRPLAQRTDLGNDLRTQVRQLVTVAQQAGGQ